MLAQASDKVVVTVEEIVDSVSSNDPTGTFIPAIHIKAVAHAPFGAYPSACPGYYGMDVDEMKKYLEASSSDETFEDYLAEEVFRLPRPRGLLPGARPGGSGSCSGGVVSQPPNCTFEEFMAVLLSREVHDWETSACGALSFIPASALPSCRSLPRPERRVHSPGQRLLQPVRRGEGLPLPRAAGKARPVLMRRDRDRSGSQLQPAPHWRP